MKKSFYSLIAFLLVLGGCKKNDTAGTSTESYFPSTVGSNWTYKITTGGTSSTTVKYTVSNRDTTAAARSYKVIEGNNGTNQYYNKTNSDYYNFRTISGQGLELLFLKDDKEVNGTWNTLQTLTGLTGLPPGITSADIKIIYTIKEKGTTRVVNGTTYSNVIKVGADLSATVAGFPFTLGTAEFYFAKNIGIIESKILLSNAQLGFNLDEKYELQSYEIK